MASAVSFVLLNAVSVASEGVLLPPSSVITGIGFTTGAGTAEGTLSVSTTRDIDLSSTVAVNPTVLAVFVYDAVSSSSIFYDGLKIRLKDDQRVFVTGLGSLSNAFAFLRVETPA